jgi:hypothetical protein
MTSAAGDAVFIAPKSTAQIPTRREEEGEDFTNIEVKRLSMEICNFLF